MVALRDSIQYTSTRHNSLNPNYDEQFTFNVYNIASVITFDVYDNGVHGDYLGG